MALDAVPGSPTANSYCTVSQATVFLHERLDTAAWYATPDPPLGLTEQREAALMWATRLIDQAVRWYGVPATTTQALAWPQTGQVDASGTPIPTTIVPVPVQRATAEYALSLLQQHPSSASTASSVSEGGVKRRRIGDTEIEYFESGVTTTMGGSATTGTDMPPEVRALLAPYGRAAGGVNIPLLRV